MNIPKTVLNVLLGLTGLGLALAAFLQSSGFPAPHDAQLGAAVFPRITGLLLACASAIIIVASLQRDKKAGIIIPNAPRVAAAFVATLLFVFLLTTAGFLLLAPLYLAVLLLLAGCTSPLKIVIASVGATALLFVMFKVLLESPLPQGPLPF